MTLLLVLASNAVAIWLASRWVNGVEVTMPEPRDSLTVVLVFLGIALVFTAVNALVKPLVSFFSLPFIILTLGLFLLVVNGLMVLLTSWLSEFSGYGLHVDGLWTAIKAGLVIWIVNWVLGIFLPEPERG
ncbi:MAG: phage holin family protein [Nocardiaceae bacterium]|nr:phage holin family protein [Nocardiaceae bacterium]